MADRVRVLLLASERPAVPQLTEIVDRLRDKGADVRLATYQQLPAKYDDAGLREAYALGPAANGHGPAFRRDIQRAEPARRFWLHVKHDPWVAWQAEQPLVILALDRPATRAANKLAQQSAHATAATDLEQAIRFVHEQATRPTDGDHGAPAASRDRLDRVPGRAARAVVAWPFLSEGRRYEIARATALSLLRSGQPDLAERTVRRAVSRLKTPRLRADLLGDVTSAILADGGEPGLVVETYAAELAVADHHLAKKQRRAAAEAFGEAMRVAFHRVVHFDRTTSPLAADPERFAAPLRDSATAQALRAPRGSTTSSAATRDDGDTSPRLTRVLVVTRENANFLGEILDHLEGHPGFESRFLDLADGEDLARGVGTPALMAQEIVTGKQQVAERVEKHLRPLLDWADVVFVDWCRVPAVLLTLVDPADTRVIVRLHSYEVFTPWPHLVDFSRVDVVLFVSDHVRDLAVAAIPALREPHAPQSRVLPLGMRLRQFAGPKPDDARFTLGLVGWGSVAKDPRWALEVVRRLREHDDRYRLLLIGDEFAADASAATRAYGTQLQHELAELERSGAVRRTGRTDDVPSALRDVGVILSTSVRESFHAGLIEGAASGAVPVVRDWPFFAGRPHSARTLFPPDWVVGSPDEAAARIVATTATDDTWRTVGGAAAEHALRRWDWDQVSHGYDRLLSR